MLESIQPACSFLERASAGSLLLTQLASSFLTDGEQKALADAASPPHGLDAKTNLMYEGEAASQVHVFVEGWACRYKMTRDGNRQIVAFVVPGDVANLDALMFSRPGYGVRVLGAAKIVSIPRELVLSLASDHPGIDRTLMRLALVENAILSQWAFCLGRRSAQQRLAHLLCEMAARVGGDLDTDTSSFRWPLTQEQLADALGLTSVHVNRSMQQLRNQGLVVTVGRSVTLPDMAKLRDMAEFDPAYLHFDSHGGEPT